MPHIHLEYSDNIDTLEVKPMLLALNQALLDAEFVQSGNEVKSRAIKQSDFVIGVDGDAEAYLHAKVSLLSGRDEATQSAISKLLLKTLQQNFKVPTDLAVQICVEIIEIPRNSYSKLVLKA
jgi:5-carboxymethyl-2-hydroxymuconate isomerase